MKIEKSWLTITEAASKLNYSPEEILHLGIIGKLKLCFDWSVCKTETDSLYQTLKLKLRFKFEEVDGYYCLDQKRDIDTSIPIAEPNYQSDPLLRLATLSANQIALINKNGEVSINEAMISIHNRLKIYLPEDAETMEYPLVRTKDIVVKLSDIIEYENLITHNVVEKKSKIESPKQLENQSKLIGLLCKALVNKSGNSLTHMGEPCAKAIANHLGLVIPEDMDASGIGYESNRKKIAAGLKKLDPNNY